jgi:nitrate reductase molybdenum cofactor assembly chaperone
MADVNEFGLLAGLLRYPEDGYDQEAERCCRFLTANCPEMDAPLSAFREQTRSLSLEALQALYTAAFDLNPLCSLEVGWHLFGENYERGEFLVKMREELRRHGIVESTELPDHLTHALELLGRMEPREASIFATACLFPALDKMVAEMAGKSDPFENVLLAIERLLALQYPRPALETRAPEPAFSILNQEG